MSKTTAIFSRTPVKNVKSSPASSRPNSASKISKNQTVSTLTESSPRKCRMQTEIQHAQNGVNVRSRMQLNYQTKSSPSCKTGSVKCSSRGEATPIKSQLNYSEPGKVDEPAKVNVKTMRSCFEKKEAKVQCRPPPSPSPSRAKPRLVESAPITPRNTNSCIRGILTSKSKYSGTPTFRVPSGGNTPVPRTPKLRRSVSTGALVPAKVEDSPKERMARSTSQTITPKHVKFLDDSTPECFSPVLLESKGVLESADSGVIAGETTNLTVAVRIRPPFSGERSVVSVENNIVRVKALGSEHSFLYDFCFPSTGASATSQQDVFHSLVEPLVHVAFQGYNVCLFAYGQTGSGKSYSMMGEDTPDGFGIIPRFSQQLFEIIESSEEYSHTKVEISYFEIYNEKIHDLLGPAQNGRSTPLRVREHPELGPYVVDLTVHNVHSFEILQDWLRMGSNHKATAATEMNMNSSRSHTIFTVTLTQSQAEDRPSLCSKINLIDLAGSERLAHTCATGDRLKEGVSINRSLLTLGKVISSLAENKKRGFIPYRESVLTWLLRESLGGNSRTAMLATINPSSQFVEETLSTLRYACQARNIVNTVRINESPNEKKIRELLEEIQMLKEGFDVKDHNECYKKINTLQQQLGQVVADLSRANNACIESEVELKNLKIELVKSKEVNAHDMCNKKINQLEQDFAETFKQNTKYREEIAEIKKQLFEERDRNLQYEEDLSNLRLQVDGSSESNKSYKKEVHRLELEVGEFKALANQLKLTLEKLDCDLTESRIKNKNYEKDIFEMKNSMLEIKNNTSHDPCDSQILMLQAALQEAERFIIQTKEKIKTLEKKCSEIKIISNHDGCEKEICALKETISELKRSADHTICVSTIEKLKIALTEAEKLVGELETDISNLKEENTSLLYSNKEFEKEIVAIKKSLNEIQEKSTHTECEDRINTLKKALTISKSMNTHIQCENRITQLELEVSNLQSVTLADHSKCEEKINNLFFAVEEYAEKYRKLVENHNLEILQYKEIIQNLENKNCENNRDILKSNENLSYIDTKMQSLKEENCRIKKKKVIDEKKVISLEEQVTSLTKQLLDLKSQLRVALREKDSSESLCTQLQEQVAQQERKLTALESSNQLSDDKENWETPSKVIRRSIAKHSLWQNKGKDRCSLGVMVDEIHQAMKDAEDICPRLNIPYVFQLEPEVTTHSWFEINVRVWDHRTARSVRWPRNVFLTWLREIKEDIISKSRGQKLFCDSTWLQNTKDSEPLATVLGHGTGWKEEMENLVRQLAILQHHSLPKDKQDVLSAVAVLKKAIHQLNNRQTSLGSNC